MRYVVIVVISLMTYAVVCKQHVQRLKCVRVTECPVFLKLLQSSTRRAAHIESVRSAHCGFDHLIEKVWCPIIVELPDEPDKPDQTATTTESIIGPRTVDTKNRTDLFPSEEECGKFVSDRIYGGNITEIDEYPFTALLYYRNKQTPPVARCGGVLISKRYVLTAAHCIHKKLEYVVLGEYDTRNETDCVYYDDGSMDCAPKPLKLRVEEISFFSPWVPSSFKDDIALLRLEREVAFNDFVSPICLPSQYSKYPDDGIKVTVTGWGRTKEENESPLKRHVSVPISSRENCSQAQGKKITPKMICAGGVANKDACFGDSGGPLIHFNGKRWSLMGIVSLSLKAGCGNPGVPGVYTWLPPYINWIYKTVR